MVTPVKACVQLVLLRIVGAPIAVPAAFVNPFMLHCTIFLDSGATSAIVQCNMKALPRFSSTGQPQVAQTVSETNSSIIAIADQRIE